MKSLRPIWTGLVTSKVSPSTQWSVSGLSAVGFQMPVVVPVEPPPDNATVTLALAVVELPPPVQVMLYELSAVSPGVVYEPEVDCVPLQAPPALQTVAFTELQVRVVVWPDVIEDGLAVSDTVGGGVVGVEL